MMTVMMVGATVGLWGLKLCTNRGLLPLAALPLTQDCHAETLQPDMDSVYVDYTCYVFSILKKKLCVHYCNLSRNKQRPAPPSICLSFSTTLRDGVDRPAYSGISWSRRCHRYVKRQILSIDNDSTGRIRSYKTVMSAGRHVKRQNMPNKI